MNPLTYILQVKHGYNYVNDADDDFFYFSHLMRDYKMPRIENVYYLLCVMIKEQHYLCTIINICLTKELATPCGRVTSSNLLSFSVTLGHK